MSKRLRFDGAFVRRVREAHGWTLRDLAKRSGLSNPYLLQLETSAITNPGIDAVIALAKAFSMNVASLLTHRPLYAICAKRGCWENLPPGETLCAAHAARQTPREQT